MLPNFNTKLLWFPCMDSHIYHYITVLYFSCTIVRKLNFTWRLTFLTDIHTSHVANCNTISVLSRHICPYTPTHIHTRHVSWLVNIGSEWGVSWHAPRTLCFMFAAAVAVTWFASHDGLCPLYFTCTIHSGMWGIRRWNTANACVIIVQASSICQEYD